MRQKRVISMVLCVLLVLLAVTGCGGKAAESGAQGETKDAGETKDVGEAKDAAFTWWIYQSDGQGTYYENYEDSPSVQYVSAQYWDVENGGIGTAESGRKLDLSFLVPITGNELENFNTMLATGEYPEIISLVVSSETPRALHESGILMDITEYVESYMPNYLAFLDKNPELKPHAQVEESDGSIHYYALYPFTDGKEDPWEGTCYRRDWIVKYAEPTEYVWDWEDEGVIKNGHPEVTPLARALEEDNLTGWKKNEVTKFQAEYGANPDEEYTDNVIFPSGTSDPLTISDWEWMFEAFSKAIAERGWENDGDAYCFSIPYAGFSGTGDLVSSFGGGTGTYYVRDGEVTFDGTSDNFKTYLECVNAWSENGWLDKAFASRSTEAYYSINTTAVNRGMVGMWCGLGSTLGTAIRVSCQDAADAADAYVMGCALPINDVYGSEAQMYREPDSMYADSKKGAAVGITTKAEEKDLAALFTYFNWCYTREGAEVIRLGLSKEQLASIDLDPDLYAEYDLDCAYTKETDEDGVVVYKKKVSSSDPLANALIGQRMTVGLKIAGTNEDYQVDTGNSTVSLNAVKQWNKYENKGSVRDYTVLLNGEESESYNKVSTLVKDYQEQNIPDLVLNGLDGWDAYVEGLEKLEPDSVTEYLQKYVDLTK